MPCSTTDCIILKHNNGSVGTRYIDNHGSGYLGMARCFSVHRRLTAQLSLSFLSLEKALAKTSYTSEKSNLYSLYMSIFMN